MDDKTYEYMVWWVRHGLPALGLLYYTLSKTWGFNHAAEVLGTITAFETFFGVCLGISTSNYKNQEVKNEV